MKFIESRRHTMRVKPGQHLSQAGVDLARRTGEGMGRFDRVITSPVPRAFETAIAMGYAVDEQVEELRFFRGEVEEEVGGWAEGFAAWAEAVRRGGLTRQYAQKQAQLLHSVAQTLPEGGAALLVSHGGIVEAQVAVCLTDADFAALGGFIDYCEGARLTYEGGRFVAVEVLRVRLDQP